MDLFKYLKTGLLSKGLASDPGATPAGGMYYNTTSNKWRFSNGSTWQDLGSGSGSGSGPKNYITNPDAENDTAGWFTFADAAAPTPQNGFGGSPLVTLTRSTSSPLRGIASFVLTKGPTNRQGDGVSFGPNGGSFDFTIDAADTNKPFTVTLDYLASAGYLANDIGVWVYDTTSSALVPMSQNLIPYTSGTFTASFNTTNSQTYRLIIYVSSTNTASYTFKFDGVSFNAAQNVVLGPVVEDPIPYTPTFTGIGTVGATNVHYAREGKFLYGYGTFVTGSPSATVFSASLPSGLVIDSSVSDGTAQICGGISLDGTGSSGNSNNALLFYQLGVSNNLIYVCGVGNGGSANNLTANIGTILFNTATKYSFWFKVPIQGWSTDVITSNSRVFRLSDYLSVGTNVTVTPSALGEFRTYKQVGGTGTGTNDATAQNGASIRANGIEIFGVGYGSNGNTGQPNRIEMFIGLNKYWLVQTYSSTGRTGWLQTDHLQLTSTVEEGIIFSYDPTTGVLVADVIPTSSSTTSRFVGNALPTGGGAYSAQANGYIDIIVSDNPLPVQYGDGKFQTLESVTGTIYLDNQNSSISTPGGALTFNSGNGPISFDQNITLNGGDVLDLFNLFGSLIQTFLIKTPDNGGGASQNVEIKTGNGTTVGDLKLITGSSGGASYSGSIQIQVGDGGSGDGTETISLFAGGGGGKIQLLSAVDMVSNNLENASDVRTQVLSIIPGGEKVGTATLVAGTVTVSNTSTGTGSRIYVTSQADGGTPGFLRVTNIVAGVSFDIVSSSNTDTSTVAWFVVEQL